MSSSALVEYPAPLRYALAQSGTQYPSPIPSPAICPPLLSHQVRRVAECPHLVAYEQSPDDCELSEKG